MDHLKKKLALDSAQYKPSLWLRYVDDTFVVWPHGLDRVHNFLNLLDSSRASINFTVEIESEGIFPFLDVVVIKKGIGTDNQGFQKICPHWPLLTL
jgi:hypothetical protein